MFFEKYKDKQKLFCDFITRSYANDKVSHAYLIETNSVSYADDLVKEFVKFLLCPNKDNCQEACQICHLIDNDSYPDLKIIDNGLKTIRKEQILELQNLYATKAIYGKYMIYVIKNVENFTNSSANNILKLLEETAPDIIAILLTKSLNLVIDTIVSRCQVLTLNKEQDNLTDLYQKYVTLYPDYASFLEKVNFYYQFFLQLEQEKDTFFLTDNSQFKEELAPLFEFGLLFYSSLLNEKLDLLKDYDKSFFLKKNTFADLLNKIDLLNDFTDYAKINCNKDLLIDFFILEFSGV